jgi:propanol-preferring alcohol dehydrogenase
VPRAGYGALRRVRLARRTVTDNVASGGRRRIAGPPVPGCGFAARRIHLDRIPEFRYDLVWRERSLRSVANVTRRDAREFLELAAQLPVRTDAEVHTLRDANVALQRVADGSVRGAAVLVP